jgi:hypothetical protein
MNAIIYLLIVILWLLPIGLGIPLAKKRGHSPHWMWFGVYPMGGWIVLIVFYFIQSSKTCQNCQQRSRSDAGFCPKCGQQFPVESITPTRTKKETVKRIVFTILIIIVVLALLFFFLFTTVTKAFADSVPYQESLKIVSSSNYVKGMIGDDIVKKGTIEGTISNNGDANGKAHLSFDIVGSKGIGRVYVDAHLEDGEWIISKLDFKLAGDYSNTVHLISNE